MVGPGPCPEPFNEQPVVQDHAHVVGRTSEALMPPLAMGQLENLRAPLLRTANQTRNPYNLSTDPSLTYFTAGTPQFGFIAPTSEDMASLQGVTNFGNSLVHQGDPPTGHH